MTLRKVLVISEGPRDAKFLKTLYSKFGIRLPEFVAFKSNIHQICQLYDQSGGDYGDLDIQGVLRERIDPKKDAKDYKLLMGKYSDIFLIFDLDFQAPEYNPIVLQKLLSHFSDSTRYGKLFINYPMLESFYHIRKTYFRTRQFDLSFLNLEIKVQALSSYKEIVSRDGVRLTQKASPEDYAWIIEHHRQKAQRHFKDDFSCLHINKKQQKLIERKKLIMVLNTACLLVPEIYPAKYKNILNNSVSNKICIN